MKNKKNKTRIEAPAQISDNNTAEPLIAAKPKLVEVTIAGLAKHIGNLKTLSVHPKLTVDNATALQTQLNDVITVAGIAMDMLTARLGLPPKEVSK